MDVRASKFRYILCFGVLVWGLGTGIVFAAVMALAYRDRSGFLHELLLWLCFLPLWLAAGLAWGALMWSWSAARHPRNGPHGKIEGQA
jgi:hypothetical protein